MDLGDTLVSDAAQEIVRALVAGFVEVAKKLPRLWRRAGSSKQELITGEIDRSTAMRRSAGDNLPAVQARQESVWEARLGDLLAEYPDAAAELRDILEEIRRHAGQPQAQQNITATATGAVAQGAMFGNVINYGNPSRSAAPTSRSPQGPSNPAGKDRP
jgi:hypothetical protein